MEKEITIFICEDKEARKEICHKYFDGEKITYVNILPAEKRAEVVKALEELDKCN